MDELLADKFRAASLLVVYTTPSPRIRNRKIQGEARLAGRLASLASVTSVCCGCDCGCERTLWLIWPTIPRQWLNDPSLRLCVDLSLEAFGGDAVRMR